MNILALDMATKTGKPAMIKAARLRGWSPADDNEADAQLLLDYATESLMPSRDGFQPVN